MFPYFRRPRQGFRVPAEESGKISKKAPKYINSPESPLYSKREHLFRLNFSKDEIIKRRIVLLVVEGYLDMIVP